MLTGGCRMTLADVRKNIDRVDKEIKQLFKERMVLADNVAQVKAETEDDIYKPDREETIISNLTGMWMITSRWSTRRLSRESWR